VFTAGTSKYGICDLESLALLTHKFEAHYLKGLIGGDIKDIPKVYYDRSPINFAKQIKAPVLILQGSIDRVVPPNQAQLIVDAIKTQGGRVEYKLFEGEGHGFKKAESIKVAYETELNFYLSCFE
jgi:dipeptidyl aminopeptidase/acylaminoacyl peptidase